MKLLFLTDNFLPEVNAPANRTYEHCKEWVKEGVEVTVITGVPNFPKGKVYPGYKNKLYQTEMIDGIKVIRVWTYISPNKGFIRRVLDYISYAMMAIFAGLFIKTDLIIATSPQLFTAIAGSVLGFLKRTKWVMEVRDLWPESIKAVGAMGDTATYRFFERIESFLYRSATHIIVVTDTFKEKLVARGVDREKISIHKNGANLSLFLPCEKPQHLVKKYDLEGKFVFAYIGTHGMAHGLHFILDSINEIKDSHPNIKFLFMGDGAEKASLLEKAAELDLTNALFLDSVSKQEVVEYLNLKDASLVNLRKSDTFLSVIPSKIFESAAVRKPILLGLEGETKGIINKYNAGICYIPEDKETFLEAVLQMVTDSENYLLYQLGCDALIKDFDRKVIAGKMSKTLRGILTPAYRFPLPPKTTPEVGLTAKKFSKTLKKEPELIKTMK